ncbi:MAG: YebC/PmpR family DNA-binding transcriptional regulator, partial [Pseudobdellovibrio sp.]
EAIEAGADDVHKNDDGSYQFFCAMENLDAVSKALQARGWKIAAAALSYKATNITELNDAQKKDVEEFLTAVDDLDDTHKVYATIG